MILAVTELADLVMIFFVKGPCRFRGSGVGIHKTAVVLIEMLGPAIGFYAYMFLASAAVNKAYFRTAGIAKAAGFALRHKVEAYAAVFAGYIAVDFAPAVIAADAAQLLSAGKTALNAETAGFANIGCRKADTAVIADVTVIIRILSAHTAVRTGFLFAAVRTETAVITRIFACTVEAYFFTVRAKLAFVYAMLFAVNTGFAFVITVSAFRAVLNTSVAHTAFLTDSIAGAVFASATSVADILGFLTETCIAAVAVKALVLKAFKAEPVSAVAASAALFHRVTALAAVVAVKLVGSIYTVPADPALVAKLAGVLKLAAQKAADIVFPIGKYRLGKFRRKHPQYHAE